jgi:hypothetical protein
MASRNYIVITKRISMSDQKEYKLRALAAGLERCAIKNVGDVNADIPGLQALGESNKRARVDLIYKYIAPIANGGQAMWPRSVDQRALAPLTDLVVPAAQDSWLTAAFAAVNGFYTCLNAVAAPQLIQGKLMVCYGISYEGVAVPMPGSRLLFRKGGAAGNIQAQFDLEELGAAEEPDGFLSEPQVIDYTDPFAIQVRARNATLVGEVFHIHNFLFESAGTTIA